MGTLTWTASEPKGAGDGRGSLMSRPLDSGSYTTTGTMTDVFTNSQGKRVVVRLKATSGAAKVAAGTGTLNASSKLYYLDPGDELHLFLDLNEKFAAST